MALSYETGLGEDYNVKCAMSRHEDTDIFVVDTWYL